MYLTLIAQIVGALTRDVHPPKVWCSSVPPSLRHSVDFVATMKFVSLKCVESAMQLAQRPRTKSISESLKPRLKHFIYLPFYRRGWKCAKICQINEIINNSAGRGLFDFAQIWERVLSHDMFKVKGQDRSMKTMKPGPSKTEARSVSTDSIIT